MSPRLQRLMLWLQCYSTKLVNIPGKLLFVADALSRCPYPESKIETTDSDPGLMVSTLIQTSPTELKQIQEAADRDPTLQKLSECIQHGWPDRLCDVHPVAEPYFHIRSELYITESFICCGQRLVIPAALQAEVLAKLHQAHCGIVACKGLASQSVYWPSLNKDIVYVVSSYDMCQSNQKSNSQQPLLDRDLPVRPWEKLVVDFFHCQGSTFILVVDYFSKYVEVKRMETTTASSVIMVLKDIFAHFGIPNVLISDQGPPFDSEAFKSFLPQGALFMSQHHPFIPSPTGRWTEQKLAPVFGSSQLLCHPKQWSTLHCRAVNEQEIENFHTNITTKPETALLHCCTSATSRTQTECTA